MQKEEQGDNTNRKEPVVVVAEEKEVVVTLVEGEKPPVIEVKTNTGEKKQRAKLRVPCEKPEDVQVKVGKMLYPWVTVERVVETRGRRTRGKTYVSYEVHTSPNHDIYERSVIIIIGAYTHRKR